MKYDNILVLMDFSQYSKAAVEAAIDFGKKYSSKLTLLNVIRDATNLTYVLSDSEYHKVEKKFKTHASDLFDKLEKEIPELKNFGYERKIRIGTPYVSCLYEIDNGNYDLVFAGSHGRAGLRKIFMGSTAEKVLRRSPVSVFITRI